VCPLPGKGRLIVNQLCRSMNCILISMLLSTPMLLLALIILLRVEPLLCDDRERGKYARDISRQRLGKHVPGATNRRTTVEVLLETVFSVWSVPRSYLEDGVTKSVLYGSL
jgi:hypothetical protein